MQRNSRGFRIGFVTKVFGLAIAGVLLAIGVMTWTTLSYIERDIEENARKQLDLAINLELALIDQHLARVQALAAMVAENQQIRDDLQQGEFATIASALRRFKQAVPDTHILTLVDRSGTAVARANSDQTGQTLRINGLVDLALGGSYTSSPEIIPLAEWEPEGEEIRRRVTIPVKATEGSEERREQEVTNALALVGVAPVKDSSGQIIGAVVAAEILNQNYTIVDEVRQRTGGLVSATIAMDGIRVTTVEG